MMINRAISANELGPANLGLGFVESQGGHAIRLVTRLDEPVDESGLAGCLRLEHGEDAEANDFAKGLFAVA